MRRSNMYRLAVSLELVVLVSSMVVPLKIVEETADGSDYVTSIMEFDKDPVDIVYDGKSSRSVGDRDRVVDFECRLSISDRMITAATELSAGREKTAAADRRRLFGPKTPSPSVADHGATTATVATTTRPDEARAATEPRPPMPRRSSCLHHRSTRQQPPPGSGRRQIGGGGARDRSNRASDRTRSAAGVDPPGTKDDFLANLRTLRTMARKVGRGRGKGDATKAYPMVFDKRGNVHMDPAFWANVRRNNQVQTMKLSSSAHAKSARVRSWSTVREPAPTFPD